MLACVSHTGVLLFKPASLDASALDDLGRAAAADVYFRLVDTPFTTLKRGQKVDHARIAALALDVRGGAQG